MIGQKPKKQPKQKNQQPIKDWQKGMEDDSDVSLEKFRNEMIPPEEEEEEAPQQQQVEKEQQDEVDLKEREYEWLDSEDEDLDSSLEIQQEEKEMENILEQNTPDNTIVFVENLHYELTDQQIRDCFEPYGQILLEYINAIFLNAFLLDPLMFQEMKEQFLTREEHLLSLKVRMKLRKQKIEKKINLKKALQENGKLLMKRKLKVTLGLLKATIKQQQIKQKIQNQIVKRRMSSESSDESNSDESLSRSRSNSSSEGEQLQIK